MGKCFLMTDSAIAEAKKIQSDSNNEDKSLRISIVGGGCAGFSYSMKFDDPTPNDNILEFGGLKVIIDHRSMVYLDGVEVNFTSGLNGSGFTFNNPNATRTCGCNKSFGV